MASALLFPLGWELWRRRLWPRAAAFLPVLFLLALYLALNHHWYGAFLPASAGAKLGQGRSGFWGRWPTAFFRTAYQLKGDFLPTLPVVLAVAVLALPGALRQRRSALVRLSLPFLGVLLLFYVLFNLPGYRWYYAPFIGFAVIYACAAVPRRLPARALLVVAILASAGVAIRHFQGQELSIRQGSPEGYPAIGRWLEARVTSTERVEAGEIGTLGWYCPRCDLIDILGLTYPKNAAHIARGDSRSWLAEDRPDYVVVDTAPWIFEDVVKASPEYRRVPVNFGPVVYVLERRDRLHGAAVR